MNCNSNLQSYFVVLQKIIEALEMRLGYKIFDIEELRLKSNNYRIFDIYNIILVKLERLLQVKKFCIDDSLEYYTWENIFDKLEITTFDYDVIDPDKSVHEYYAPQKLTHIHNANFTNKCIAILNVLQKELFFPFAKMTKYHSNDFDVVQIYSTSGVYSYAYCYSMIDKGKIGTQKVGSLGTFKIVDDTQQDIDIYYQLIPPTNMRLLIYMDIVKNINPTIFACPIPDIQPYKLYYYGKVKAYEEFNFQSIAGASFDKTCPVFPSNASCKLNHICGYEFRAYGILDGKFAPIEFTP